MKEVIKYIVIALIILAMGCNQVPTPKPRGYFKINFPEKQYLVYDSICPYSFEYPIYGKIEKVNTAYAEPCWFNISFPAYNAKIHITYKELNNNLAMHIEDVRTLVNKHIIKADDIVENMIIQPEKKVYGIIYNLKGNTAAASTFFITDSSKHFLTGSLYFNVHPNKDSLAPAIQFFQEDIVHLTKSLYWK